MERLKRLRQNRPRIVSARQFAHFDYEKVSA